MNDITRGQTPHLEILRLLDLCDGIVGLNEAESGHLARCEHCRTLLRAFASDRAKQLYRQRQDKAKSA